MKRAILSALLLVSLAAAQQVKINPETGLIDLVGTGGGGGGGATIESTANVIKGDGAGNGVAATPGTDYVIPAGNVATATALAANGANCSAGQIPLGITAAGAAEGCYTINATQVTFTPAGTISATTVAAALAELDGDIVALTAGAGGNFFCRDTGSTDTYACLMTTVGINGILTTPVVGTTIAITSIVDSSSTATVTTTGAHGRISGEYITIAGVTGDTDLNGTYVITVTSSTVFTYTSASVTDATYNNVGITAYQPYPVGWSFVFDPNTTSTYTSGSTLNIDSKGARDIYTEGGAPISDGYLVGTNQQLYVMTFDGRRFIVFGSSTSMPSPTGNEWATVTTDGFSALYSFKGGKPSSGAQTIDAVGDIISPDREYVEVSLNASYTLTSTPTIADGAFNGERITITNVTNFNLILQDEANLANTNLRLGGSNLTSAYRGSATLVWNAALSAWVRAITTSSITTVPVTFSLPFCSFATHTGTTGSGGNGWSKGGSGSLTTIGIDSNGTNCWTPFAAAYAGESWVNLSSVIIPAGWDGNAPSITFAHWLTTSSTMGAGERVDWLVSVACVADGESGAPTFNSTNTFSTTYPASPAGKRYFITETDQDVTGCAAGELMAIKYIRSASDTGSQVAMGRSITLTFRVTP